MAFLCKGHLAAYCTEPIHMATKIKICEHCIKEGVPAEYNLTFDCCHPKKLKEIIHGVPV